MSTRRVLACKKLSSFSQLFKTYCQPSRALASTPAASKINLSLVARSAAIFRKYFIMGPTALAFPLSYCGGVPSCMSLNHLSYTAIKSVWLVDLYGFSAPAAWGSGSPSFNWPLSLGPVSVGNGTLVRTVFLLLVFISNALSVFGVTVSGFPVVGASVSWFSGFRVSRCGVSKTS